MSTNLITFLQQRFSLSFVVLSLLCVACAQPEPPSLIEQPPPEPILQSIGEELFLDEDFANALLEFEHDYETALSLDDKNVALYGLACTQLVLARTDEQLAEAMGNLEKWAMTNGHAPFSENRSLLVAALKIQNEYLQKKQQDQALLIRRKNTIIANQRNKINQMASTIDTIQKQIDDRQKQLEDRQKQLEELEAIDATLQEKKKPL